MYLFKLLITFIRLFLAFTIIECCKKDEDCSKQIHNTACSFCIGETNFVCYYPFLDRYRIDENTKECSLKKKNGACGKNPCQNDGVCVEKGKVGYLCRCPAGYVGRNCEKPYSKLALFNVYDIEFDDSVPLYEAASFKVNIVMPRNNTVNDVKIVVNSVFYPLKYPQDEKCYETLLSCDHDYTGVIWYFYKTPKWSENNQEHYNGGLRGDDLLLGETRLGHFEVIRLVITHKGTTIFDFSAKVFVKFPKVNYCVPLAKVSECGTYNKIVTYNTLSTFRLSASITIVPSGNAKEPFEQDKDKCEGKGTIVHHWRVRRMEEEASKIDSICVEKSKSSNIQFEPFQLTCGKYGVELKVTNILTYETSPITHTFCYFEIKALPLEAKIWGGTYRIVSIKDDLKLNAGDSKDPNMPPGEGWVMANWSCIVLNSSKTNDAIEMCKPVILKSTEIYTIPSDKLIEGEYNFTLKISRGEHSGISFKECAELEQGRIAYQHVVVTNESNVLILCDSNCGTSVSVDNVLVLKASYLDNPDGIEYQWACFKVEKDRNIPLIIPQHKPSYILEIQGNTLQYDSNYKVTVSMTFKGLNNSAGAYTFKTEKLSRNQYSGNCSINPSSGIRSITNFHINCSVMEGKALVFEFYDVDSMDRSKNVSENGRMLGISNGGELLGVILTRGVVVVYITCENKRVNKTFEVTLTNDTYECNKLLNKMLHNPNFLQKLSYDQRMQYILAAPDITLLCPNNGTNTLRQLFHTLLENVVTDRIVQIGEIKLNSLLLQNILSTSGKGNMNLQAVLKTRTLGVGMSSILKQIVLSDPSIINLKEVKTITSSFLNILVLSLSTDTELGADGTSTYISSDTYFDLAECSEHLAQMLENIQMVLAVLQTPGVYPTTISSDDKSFIFRVLKEDSVNNYRLSEMLNKNSDISVSFSTALMNQFENILLSEENLSLGVATTNKKLFQSLNKNNVSNLVSIFLNKHTAHNRVVSIRKIPLPVDIELYSNESINEVKKDSKTIPLDIALDEHSLDLQIKVHRLDPIVGSKLSVTFLYPPTNNTLRVLIIKDYRPTYKMMMTQARLISKQSPYCSLNTRTDPNTIYYMGVLPGPTTPLSHSVSFSFTTNMTSCVSWEKTAWSSSGCSVGQNTTGHRIHCQCRHLSIFGAIFPYLPNRIDPFADAKLFLTVWDNPLVVSLMVVLFIGYVILCFISCHMDNKDRFRETIIFLEDNYPYDGNPYLLVVYTSSRLFAGTSANVGVQLIGESNNSRAHILRSRFRKVLTRNSDDWFLLLSPKDLGIINCIHIWHDHAGCSPDWYCNKIYVYDVQNNLEFLFLVDHWIRLSLREFPEAVIVLSSNADVLEINKVLNNNVSKCFKEHQSLIGIFTQNPKCITKRIQIVNIFMCSCLLSLLCSIMFYKSKSEEILPDYYKYRISMRELYISFVALATVIFFHYVISLLFRKSYKHYCDTIKDNSSLFLRQSVFFEDLINPEGQSSRAPLPFTYTERIHNMKGPGFKKRLARLVKHKLRPHNLVPAVLPGGDSGIRVNKNWLIITYVVCAIIVISCSYLIMLYGLKMGLEKSKTWITAVVMSELDHTLFMVPLDIIVIATVLAVSFGFVSETAHFRVTEDDIKMSTDKLDHMYLQELITKRRHPMYSPIDTETRARLVKKKRAFFKRIHLLQFFLSLCYIFCIVCIVQQIRYLNFSRVVHLETMINNPDQTVEYFYDSYNIEGLRYYFANTFLNVIYKTTWYNSMPFHGNGSSPYWTSDYSWRMIGIPYITQKRVYEESCHSIAPPQQKCIPSWSSQTEDTDSYDVGWISYSDFDIKGSFNNPWTYSKPTEGWLKTFYRLQGSSDTVYNNGGYKAKLGSSIQETFKVTSQLQDNSWVDQFTKVLFVELTLYNVNVESLSQITLIIEFLTTGVSLKEARITSVISGCNELTFKHIASVILTFIFLLEIFFGINYYGFTSYCKDIRNFLLILIVIPSFFVIMGYFIYIYYCKTYDIWETYYEEKYDYFDFDKFFSFYTYIIYLLSFFLFFGVWRSLKLFRSLKLLRPLIQQKILKLYELSFSLIFSIFFLFLLVFTSLFLVLINLELSSSHRIMALIVSLKKPQLNGDEYFTLQSMTFYFIHYCTTMLLSALVIATLISFYPVFTAKK